MTDTSRAHSDLVYFTHTLHGGTYGGWYRLLSQDCIEVLAIGLMQTLPLNGRPPADVACEILEAFIRARQRLGQPVPTLPERAAVPQHRCPEKSAAATH